MKAVLYARYSTGAQSPLSIEDQLRLCRDYAARLGAHVVRELADAERSGFSAARPGLAELLALVEAGGCDLVVAEHSDRLARDGEKGWAIFNLLRARGVRYATVQEGEVGIVHQGVSALVSELKGEEVRLRTRRGLAGVVEAGRSGGGLTYGYRKVRAYDAAGEPLRGLLEIDEGQAEVVRRIFRDYADGVSPLAIAAALNAEGVAAPRGGPWNASTIAGNAARAAGVLNNELYVGWRVWGRRTFVKDRATGSRRGRPAEGPPLRKPAPELRIVPDALWAAVRARQVALARPTGARPDRRRPKRFLAGLIVCGLCGGPMTRAGPKQALRCATRAYRRACANTAAPGYPGIEARVIAAIRGNLLHPDVIAHAIASVQAAERAAQAGAGKRRARLAADLAEVKRRAGRLLDQVADGVLSGAAIVDKLAGLEARRSDIERQLAEAGSGEVVAWHPAAAARFAARVEQLTAALDDPEDAGGREDRSVLRALISEIRFTPRPGRGRYDLEIVGDLAPILQFGANEKGPLAGAPDNAQVMRELGAGTGFEPVTFRL